MNAFFFKGRGVLLLKMQCCADLLHAAKDLLLTSFDPRSRSVQLFEL